MLGYKVTPQSLAVCRYSTWESILIRIARMSTMYALLDIK